MKKLLAVFLTLTMLVTLPAFGASADTVNGSQNGVLPENFTKPETTPGGELYVKVSDVTHKYAVDISFNATTLTLGGSITWNVQTMQYDVTDSALTGDQTSTVNISNRSDLPVYAYAVVTDAETTDNITFTSAYDSDTKKLTIAKSKVGEPTVGPIAITVKSEDWNAAAAHYAAKRLASTDQATATFTIATVTVTISKN